MRSLLLCLFAALCLPLHAQVGWTQRQAAGLPYQLLYPTEAVARPIAMGPFEPEVAVDAEPAPGRRRLVVLSHGTGGSALVDHALARELVMQGLVVAQPLHQGDNHRDARDAGPVAFERRPREISAVIDALAADPQWAPRLQLDRVGVHGMSAGGHTALVMAGARWRLLDLVRHCQQDDDPGFCFQGALTPAQRAERQARFDSVRGVPEAQLPATLTAWHGGREAEDPRPDPRIAAVTVAVPVSALLSAESLARIGIPVGVVVADADAMLRPRFHAERVLAHCGRCARLALLKGAGHFDVLWPWPAAIAQEVALKQPVGGTLQPGFDATQRGAAQRRIATFLREQLG